MSPNVELAQCDIRFFHSSFFKDDVIREQASFCLRSTVLCGVYIGNFFIRNQLVSIAHGLEYWSCNQGIAGSIPGRGDTCFDITRHII